ncbi:unnamed protein product [Sphagnum balticum]
MFEIILNLTEKFCEHLKIDPDNESLTISASKRFIYIRTVSHGNSIRRTWRFESRYNPQGEFLGIYEYLPHLDTSEERREKIKDVIRNGPDLIQADEMRKAFFAGAEFIFGTIMMAVSEGDEITPADLRRMDQIGFQNETIHVKDGSQCYFTLTRKTNNVALIIANETMEPMNGIALLRFLRAHKESKSVPFILMASFPTKELAIQVLNYGNASLLIKPFPVTVLSAQMEKMKLVAA